MYCVYFFLLLKQHLSHLVLYYFPLYKYLMPKKNSDHAVMDVSGLVKKMDALAARTGFELVGRWRKSITNHPHWCAASTPSADGSIMVPKWKSLPNHFINIHEGHSDEYPASQHEPVDDKEWFDPGILLYFLPLCCLNNVMMLYIPLNIYTCEKCPLSLKNHYSVLSNQH